MQKKVKKRRPQNLLFFTYIFYLCREYIVPAAKAGRI